MWTAVHAVKPGTHAEYVLSSSSEVTLSLIWNILFVVPRIKMIVNLNLLWSELVETMQRFDLFQLSTDLGHACL